MKKYILLTDQLQFVSLTTGTIHARDTRYPSKTLCGRRVYAVAEVRPQWELSSSVLCRKCADSLGTYTGRMGAMAHVRVESEVAG